MFQIAVVRLLPTVDYARYALAVALAALLQTITSLGLPRVAAMILSGTGERLSHRAARTLAFLMLAVRILACGLGLALAGLGISLFAVPISSPPMIYAGAAYAVLSSVQLDADGVVQALGLQIASRRAAIAEPLVRCAGVLGLAMTGAAPTATAVLWIVASSSGLAMVVLLLAAFTVLAGRPSCESENGVDWAQVRSVAIGGYGGTLSWLAFSPAVIRLIASRVLPVGAFAGFSFVQTLAVSLQRYAPSFTLFPLIEPAVMADAARRGRPDRLRAALSLLVKADALAIGAVIVGVSVAGALIIKALAHGRYADAAIFLPWLLMGIVANASHRSYEIAAIALGQARALALAFMFTLGWLALALACTSRFGVWPLLIFPLADALTRFWFVQRALDRRGAPSLLDPAVFICIGSAAAAMSLSGAALARLIQAGLMVSLCIGTMAAFTFLGLTSLLRPIQSLESALLRATAPWLWRLFTRRKRERSKPLCVVILTPRGLGGTGGVDRLMDSLRPAFAARRDVSVVSVTTRGRRLWLSPVFGVLALVRLAAKAALGRLDMIHVNLGADGSCYRKMALIAIPRLLGAPFIIHLHGSAFPTFWYAAPRFARKWIDRLFRDAAQVVVLGDAGRRLVIERLPDVASRTTVLPNATPLFEARRRLCADEVQILFLGDLSARKGASVLLEALGRLKTRSSWRAVIAGDGDTAAVQRLAHQLGLSKQVAAPGWVGPADVNGLLATSDILVLPSFEEALPLAVIEAFAAGLAVIATPVGSLPDILMHGKTGLFVTPGDVDALAGALSTLIDDKRLREGLGGSAQAHHAAHLALGPYQKRLMEIWRTYARSKIVQNH